MLNKEIKLPNATYFKSFADGQCSDIKSDSHDVLLLSWNWIYKLKEFRGNQKEQQPGQVLEAYALSSLK